MTPTQIIHDSEIALSGAIITILEHACDDYTIDQGVLLPIAICSRITSHYLDAIPQFRRNIVIDSLIGELMVKKQVCLTCK